MGSLDYPGTVFGVSPEPGESAMPDIASRYTRALALHRYDVPIEPGPHAVLGKDWEDAGTPSPAVG
jgi:hypothetical protein